MENEKKCSEMWLDCITDDGNDIDNIKDGT